MESKNLEDETLDADEIAGADVEINPETYIHHGLLKAQKALIKDNMSEGLIQFRLIVEHVEVLCKASNMISDEYEKELNKYIKSKEYTDTPKESIKSVRLANKKLELMLKDVFSTKTIISPLKT